MIQVCTCGRGDQHSLRQGAKCDGMRRYGASYKEPTDRKKQKVRSK